MSRLGQFETASDSLPEKTAAAVDVEKVASEAVRGYVETQAMIKQAAAVEYQRGYNETVAEIEKVAADQFSQGAQDCASLLNHLSA
jgi:soluble cytochrome b562